MRIFIASLGAVILLSASSARAADETYLLQTKAQRGQVRQIDVVVHHDRLRTTTINGVARPPVAEKGVSYFKATVTIAEVKDGSPVAAVIQADPKSRDVTIDANGQEQSADSPLAGAKFAIRRADDNTFTSDYKGDLTDAQWGALKPLLTPGTGIFPDHPIAVGDEWDPTKTIKPFLTLGPTDDATIKCHLDSVKIENNHRIADITTTVTEVRHLALNVQVDIKDISKSRFDIDAGAGISASSKVTGTISTPPGAAVQVSGTISDSTESKAQTLPDDAAATTAPAGGGSN